MTKQQKIYKELKNLIKNSYSPYSKFATATIVETDKGFFKGVNVENSSSGATVCSERNAIFNAVAFGAKQFKALYCLTSSKRDDIISCGMCLQVMYEFFKTSTPIYFFNVNGKCKKYTLKQLLPYSFTPTQLLDKKGKK